MTWADHEASIEANAKNLMKNRSSVFNASKRENAGIYI